MVVGAATVTFRLHAAGSLKEKRSVVKRMTARVRDRFNVAAAEVDDHDAWGVITLGLACVSTEAAHAHAVLQRAVDWLAEQRLDADLVDYTIEMC
ncbi:DUF503 domain-containing protein [bacterium]|nr:MAG: DUF503 domain-containing protein [bacterium]